jgi:hypothetical protein
MLAVPESGRGLLLLDLSRVWRMRPVAAGLFTAALTDLTREGLRTAAAGRTADQLVGIRRFARPADALSWLLHEIS